MPSEGFSNDIVKLNKRISLLQTEQEEIEKRKTSVVIKGLPENNEHITDLEACKQLLHVQILSVADNPTSAKRIGQVNKDGTSRPVRLILTCKENQKEILEKGKTLKDKNGTVLDFDPAAVFINPDLTIMQREAAFSRRMKDWKKRQNQQQNQENKAATQQNKENQPKVKENQKTIQDKKETQGQVVAQAEKYELPPPLRS